MSYKVVFKCFRLMWNCLRMFWKVSELSSIVFGLFYTMKVFFCGSNRIWLSSWFKVVLGGKKCVVALVVFCWWFELDLDRLSTFYSFSFSCCLSYYMFCGRLDGSDVREGSVTQYCQTHKHSTMLLCTSKEKLWRQHTPQVAGKPATGRGTKRTVHSEEKTRPDQRPPKACAVKFKETSATTAITPHGELLKPRTQSQQCNQRGRGSFRKKHNCPPKSG